MSELKSTERLDRREKCILVGVLLPEGDFNPDDPLDEIRGLAKTAGLVVAGTVLPAAVLTRQPPLERWRRAG